VLSILERCLTVFDKEPSVEREIAFHDIVDKYGADYFRAS